ncbi:MAG: hypothetical protein ACP5UB_02810 [Candidatus Sumerlaeaceae bacterium]
MMKILLFIALLFASLFIGGCAYNSRTNTFGWARTERPVPPPAYPIPDLSPTPLTNESRAKTPPPAEW